MKKSTILFQLLLVLNIKLLIKAVAESEMTAEITSGPL